MRKYGESKTTRIMMATVPHVTSGLGFRKFQADGFLLTRVCNTRKTITLCSTQPNNKLPLQLRKYDPLHTQAHTPLVMEICHVSVNHKGKHIFPNVTVEQKHNQIVNQLNMADADIPPQHITPYAHTSAINNILLSDSIQFKLSVTI